LQIEKKRKKKNKKPLPPSLLSRNCNQQQTTHLHHSRP